MILSGQGVLFREPTEQDGAAIWELIRDTGVLDLNSPYCYMMLGRYFGSTCMAAERDGRLIGFASGFVPPRQADTLFIWQIAVDATERGNGIGTSLARELLARPELADIRYAEATVSPSNAASAALFRSLTRQLDALLSIEPCFRAEQFPAGTHEDENLYRIGPFRREEARKEQTV